MFFDIKDITVFYNKSMAVQNVSIGVSEGEIVSIIGANGAGKSTILKALTAQVPLRAGEISFQGLKISGIDTSEIVRKGIALVPEGRQLFPYMSVLSNLKLGASLRSDKKSIEESLEYVYKLFPRLKDRTGQKAGTMSGGEQQMLAIGRALMANPRLLCMDEPSLGLAPRVVELVGEAIKDINKSGVSVLLVEQNVHLAIGVANRGYVLQVGKVILEGEIESIKSSEIVKMAYLGG